MTKYKYGDKVRITGKSQVGYDYIGKTGTVTYVSKRHDGAGKLWVNVDVHNAHANGARANQTFHLDAIEPAHKPAPGCNHIVILRDELGKVAPSKSPVEHMSLDEAVKEAERLSAKYKGQFEVWQQVAVTKPLPAPQFKRGDFVRATRETKCEVVYTKIAKGQVVQVLSDVTEPNFNSSPLPGNPMPCLTTSHFEPVS